ncbi:hypothetical protein [Granulicella pectinivorans]|uniref:hypothetical protein n=1 Tax=Granulicella pectinivorans TaxID=474950 RepID=UPI0011403E91|nr:hypothetical protein [Granulicella pectinivorans]
MGNFIFRFFRQRSESRDREISLYQPVTPSSAPVTSSIRLFSLEEMYHLTPELLAALWMLYQVRSEEIPELAASLLERGFDTPSLRRLAGENRPTHADVADLVADTLRALHSRLPKDEVHARTIICRYLAAEAIAGRIAPFEAGDKIASLHDWDTLTYSGQIAITSIEAEEWNTNQRIENEPQMLEALQNYLKAATPSPTQ